MANTLQALLKTSYVDCESPELSLAFAAMNVYHLKISSESCEPGLPPIKTVNLTELKIPELEGFRQQTDGTIYVF